MALKVVKKTKPKINPREVLQEKRSYGDRVQKELEDQGVDFFRPSEDGGSLNIDKDYLTLPKISLMYLPKSWVNILMLLHSRKCI